MSKHIHIHLPHRARTADTFNEADHPRDGGKFTSGGGGHALSKHPTEAAAKSNVAERHAGITGQGFKHEKTEGSPDDVGGQNHHFAHPDGSRAVITHKQDAVTGRHSVISHINTMNQGKK